jgi:Flp pilus assembly protein CpaB
MTYRIRNISIAIALALVAALLTSFYVTNYQRDVRKNEANVPVFVAKIDIPAGTSGADVVRSGMMNKTEIVRRGVVPGAISNPAQLATLVTTEPIYAGEQVTTRRFATPSERGILAQLTAARDSIPATQLLADAQGRRPHRCRHLFTPRGKLDPLQPDHPAQRLGFEGA